MDDFVKLKEWIVILLKNRDVMHKSILSFEEVGDDFIVHKDAGDILFFIRPVLSDIGFLDTISGQAGLVVLNTKKNLDFLVFNWSKFASVKGLCVYFVNPSVDDKWLLYPFTHDQITERSALKRGLLSLFESVPEVLSLNH